MPTIEERKEALLLKMKNKLTGELRLKTNKGILATYSYEDQINTFSEMAEITAKALAEDRVLTPQEYDRLEELYKVKDFIDNERIKYHQLVDEINGFTTLEDIIDYYN